MDSRTGALTVDFVDAEPGRCVIRTAGETDDILDRNAQLRQDGQQSDWGKHVASIPTIIELTWLNEEWARGNRGLRYLSPEWRKLVFRKLQDPDWAWLRVDGPKNRAGWGD